MKFGKQLYALIWTTTPWTIPSNMAISYSKKMDYAIFRSKNELFLLNPKLIESIENELDLKFEFVKTVNGELLNDLTYEHSLKRNSKQYFIECDFVDENKGTGLVHNSPNHGHEDYLLFTSRNLKFEDSLVDENGCFNARVAKYLPQKAIGLSIFKEGSDFVIEFMKDYIVKASPYSHSYPYDWRTKQPVFTTVKNQFFINIKSIREQCLDAVEKTNLIPPVFANVLKTNIAKRTEWCISRQRCWGVPIPAFYSNNDSDHIKPIIKHNLIEHINQLIIKQGANCWWSNDIKDFLPDHLLKEEQLPGTYSDYSRETDILDVWFDSGMAWNYVLSQHRTNGKQQADLIVEGQDQLRGWFLSSLILGVAIQGSTPFKNIFVHGFALDKDSKKMSKSLGNVIDPKQIVDGELNYGADVFRLWVAQYANSHTNVSTKIEQFTQCKENLQKWRKILRFAIANMNDFTIKKLVNYKDMYCMDRFILYELSNYNRKMKQSYSEFNLDAVYQETNNLLNWISGKYFVSIKNTLYNESINHQKRRSIQTTLFYVVKVIEQNLNPILPFFFINFKRYHPVKEEHKDLLEYFHCPVEWNNEHLKSDFNIILQIQDSINQFQINETISPQFKLYVFAKTDEFKNSMKEVINNDALMNELSDILMVQSIDLNPNDGIESKFDINRLEKLVIDSQSTGETEEEIEANEIRIKQLRSELISKLKDKNDKVSKYIETDSFDLVLERTECRRCLRCRLYNCDDSNLIKPICSKCHDFLTKHYPDLV